MTIHISGTALAVLFLTTTTISAQTDLPEQPPPSFGSLHGITSPRAIALGRSLAARSGAIDGWKSNPATIAGTTGAGAYHTFGEHALETAVMRSNSAGSGIWITIPAATLALHYTSDELDDVEGVFPGTNGLSKMRSHDRTIAVSLATDYFAPFSFGASVKQLRDVVLRSPALGAGYDNHIIYERSNIYADLGAILSMKGMLEGTDQRDSIHLGVALLNLGGDLKGEWQMEGDAIAQRLRIGGAYDFVSTTTLGTGVRASLTAEYSRILNAASSLDYGALGAEAVVDDIFSIRVGMQFHPSVDLKEPRRTRRLHPSLTTSMGVFGSGTIDTSPWYSFGLGVNLPLRKIGIDLPLTIGADYAHPIPRDSDGYKENMLQYSLFEVRASYAAPLLE